MIFFSLSGISPQDLPVMPCLPPRPQEQKNGVFSGGGRHIAFWVDLIVADWGRTPIFSSSGCYSAQTITMANNV